MINLEDFTSVGIETPKGKKKLLLVQQIERGRCILSIGYYEGFLFRNESSKLSNVSHWMYLEDVENKISTQFALKLIASVA